MAHALLFGCQSISPPYTSQHFPVSPRIASHFFFVWIFTMFISKPRFYMILNGRYFRTAYVA